MSDMKKQTTKPFELKSLEAATEGIVLLKNDGNALPIKKDETISVFGRPMIELYRSGTGSGGAVRVDYSTNVIDGLINSDIKYNKTIVDDYTEWLKDHPFDNGGGGWAAEPWFQKDMEITVDYAKKQAEVSDKAVYVIGRTAGEDKDNYNGEGSYLLTAEEVSNIENICQAFDTVIVLMNVSNIVDMKWMNNEKIAPSLKAVLYVWSGGMEGGSAIGQVLTGEVTPSGKLPDTIAYSLEDYPSAANFGDPLNNLYQEDIYVGYRYFETFAKDKVMFPFGYGISYTDFSIETKNAKVNGENIDLDITVTNTGDTFSGKEVVQVYVSAPQGELGKPAVELKAFAKTDIIEPGKSQDITISFKISDMASYDDSNATGNKSCYVLEAGDYKILVGNNVRDIECVYTYTVDELVVVEQLSEVACPDDEKLTLMKPGAVKADGTYELTYVPSQKPTVDMAKRIEENLPEEMPITGDKGISLFDVKDGKASLDEFVSQLSVEEMAQMVRGEGMSNPRVTQGTASAFGGISDALFNYGIPAACCADGPSGLRYEGVTVQLPIGTALAASWNTKLVRELYTMEGEELRKNNVDTLLGPGVNIHRHPLNGRNFEYYSEDPYLSGVMAVASTGGIKDGGAWGTIKHYALNGQESHRFKINAVCSERAIREIYLKSFEMAVKEDTVMALMTSYNPINGHWAASNYDLCTTVLRGEWGYKGIVMTDWWAKMNDVVEGGEESNQDIRDMVRSQNDVYMVVNNNGAEVNSNNDNTEESVANGTLTIGELQRAAKNICTFILNAPVIDRELVDTDVAKHYDADESGQAKYEAFNLGDDNKVMFNSGKQASVIVPETAEYTVIVKIMFEKSNLSQSTVNVSTGKETMVVIQTNGTDGNWITQKLCKVQLDEGVYNLDLVDVLEGIKVEYIQFKKINKKK